MNAGVVQQVDTPQVLYDTPCNLFVAGFIGSPQMNFLDAVCQKKGDKVVLKVGPADIELPPAKAKKLIDGGYEGKTVVLGIRPEDVHDEQMLSHLHRIQLFRLRSVYMKCLVLKYTSTLIMKELQ